MKEKSKQNQALIYAYELGYRTDGVNAISHKNKLLSLYNGNGYLSFNIRYNKDVRKIHLHKLVAYEKYGDEMFKEGIQVRHLNGNSLDNSFDNILIGTASENQMDKSKETRMRCSLIATSFAKKHNHEKILEMHNKGMSYGMIMKETGIKSKGTISFIIKNSITSKSVA